LIPVTIDPSDPVESIKKAVEKVTGIEVPKQVLTFKNKELVDGHTAADSGLSDGDIIDLAPNTITVQVRTPEGKMIPVTIDPSDPISAIKESVAPEAAIDPDQQVLTFEGSNLPDNEAANDMGLKDGSVIDLQPRAITVKVRTADGKMIPVPIKPSNTIQSIKEAVAAESGIPVPDQLMLFKEAELLDGDTADTAVLKDGDIIDLEPKVITVQVRTPDGKMIPVQIDPFDKIESIKAAVADEAGIEVPDQLMLFNEEELQDGNTADASGLKNGSIIDLEPKHITVQVRTPDGKMIPVKIDPFDRIKSIKTAVAEEAGIEVPDQLMMFNEKELQDGDTADASGLKNGSIIDLEPKIITVQVRTPEGKMISVTIDPFDKIESIKGAVAEEAGIEVPDQLMMFNEVELQDGDTADASGLKNGSIIDLEPKVITVQVRTPDGKMIPVRIDPFDKIESIKAAVAEESGIEVPDQLMMFNEKELQDGDTADGAGLKNGSIIDLEPKFITVQVRTPDGKLIPVKIDPFDKIQSIKDAVADESGIEVPEQLLKFDGKELVDDETADAAGLKNGSIIDLEPLVLEPSITIQVKCPDDKIISLTIQPSKTIEAIKQAVAPESGIEVADQILKYDNKKLPNDETAASLGLTDGCMVILSKFKAKPVDPKKAKKEKKKKKSKDKDCKC
jgi:hypothetical protein